VKRVAQIISSAFILALVTFALLVATGQLQLMMIYGKSMRPHVHQGDLALGWRQDSYRVGDVVGYRGSWASADHTSERVIMHRIVGRERRGFVLRGDNNDANDPTFVQPGQIIGRKILLIHGGGKIFSAIRSWAWTVFLLALAFSILRPLLPSRRGV
jgi:signal peptidase I